MNKRKPLFVGILASFSLSVLYGTILTLGGSVQHTLSQFVSMWPWITVLIMGFGVQIGLYTQLRMSLKEKSKHAAAEVAASGGVSAASMIACCAHHLVDLLPILGLSAAALFLAEFQIPFIILGIFSNLIGMGIILNVMRKHDIYPNNRFFIGLFKLNFKRVSAAIATVSLVVVAGSFILVGVNANASGVRQTDFDFSAKIYDENNVTFEVTPVDFSFGEPLSFRIKMNTHQVDLSFDLTQISEVVVNDQTLLAPVAWEGAGPGGHHREGILVFPEVSSSVQKITLVVNGVADVQRREFSWSLNDNLGR